MLYTIFDSLVNILFKSRNTEPEVQEQAVKEEKPFSIGHEWPFPSPEPTNPEYLVGELIRGVEREGDHVFFYWEGQKRRHIRTPAGTETVLARHIVWWMEGRKVPAMANGLTTNCGEPKCIKLSHLILRMPQLQYGPANQTKPEPKHVVNRTKKSSQPTAPPSVKRGNRTPLAKFSMEDRNKCITRKGFFPDEDTAERKAREYNRPEVRGTGPRQYAYPCTQGCGGFHLTKINPKKYGKKKVGAW
jgi:hypothetical protein